jgi:hypothetical protein
MNKKSPMKAKVRSILIIRSLLILALIKNKKSKKYENGDIAIKL